jgi:hypothetical protein
MLAASRPKVSFFIIKVGFVVYKAALGQIFPATHSTDCSTLIIVYHQGLVQ